MNETESMEELVAFHDEIRKIKAADRSMHEVVDIDKLGEIPLKIWNEFKEILKISEPSEIFEACKRLDKKTFETHIGTLDEGHQHLNTDEDRFLQWLRNKLTPLESLSEGSTEKDLSPEELDELLKEIDTIKKHLGL